MQSDINLLLQVQEKDVEIRSLKKESVVIPEELNKTKKQLMDTENIFKQKQEDLKQLKVSRKDLEGELDSKLTSIDKYDKQLAQVKTNEEYKALEKEIKDLKYAAALQEDKILEKMEEIEKMQDEIQKYQQEVEKVRELLKQHEKDVALKLKDIESAVLRMQTEKNELVLKVPEEMMDKYNRIFENKSDSAVVPVENKSCGGCHMKLPPNVVNEIIRGHDIIICDNCSRIVYWPDVLSEEKEKQSNI